MATKSKKGRKVLIFSILILVVVGLTLAAVFRKRDVVVTVQTEKVGRRNLTEMVVANGKIQPVLQVVICPEVSGEITELPIKEGQKVNKGDLLLKIKPENYRAMRTSAEANYLSAMAGKTQAEANLTRAESDYERAKKLSASNLISEQQLLEAKTTWEVSKATLETCTHQIEQAKASLAKADDDLAKTTIYSPMSGTITKLKSQKGERVVGTAMMAGTEILTVADLENMEARVDIGEVDVILIATGQVAHLEVDAFRDRKFTGLVTDIANSSKGAAGSAQDATKFEVKIRVQEKEIFRPGMSVTAEIETRSRSNVLAVPIQSVTSRRVTNSVAMKSGETNGSAAVTNLAKAGEGKFNDTNKVADCVFVLEGDAVKVVPVKHGISDETHMEITDGLAEGVEIVTGGYKAINRDLDDGKKVKKGTPEKEEKKS
jgi:HlyD family secretion protein